MRVITGSAKGKKLITLLGDDVVRPTADRVKEGIFSAIQFDIEGRRILDLFAGSGQLGIEALSRGAEKATFVDNSEQAANVIKKNLENTALSDKAKVLKGDFLSFAASCREEFDIAFVDPPYKSALFEKAIEALSPLMSEYGIILCEHPINIQLSENIKDFSLSRSYKYGKIVVDLYRKRGGE